MQYSQDILNAALEGLQLKLDRINDQIASVRKLTGKKVGRPAKSIAAADDWEAPVAAAPKKAKKRGKRNLSPEARERIAAAQKARWAAFHAKKG